MDCSLSSTLSMGFSRREYWSGLPVPPPGDFPHPVITLVSPALAGRFFTTASPGNDSSVGEESTCNSGDPSSIPGWVRSPGEEIGYPLQYSLASLVAQLVRSTCNVGDLDLIPGLGRSSREGKGYSLQYSVLETSLDCIVYGVTKSQPQLRDFHFHLGSSIRHSWD